MTKEKLLDLLESGTVYYGNKNHIIVKESDGIWVKNVSGNDYQLVFFLDDSFAIDPDRIYTSPISDDMEDKFFSIHTDAEKKLETLIKRYPMVLDEITEIIHVDYRGMPFIGAPKEVFVERGNAWIKLEWNGKVKIIGPQEIIDTFSIIRLIHLIEKNSFNYGG